MKKILASGVVLFTIFSQPAGAREMAVMEGPRVFIAFDERLRPAAGRVADLYPQVRAELEERLGWRVTFNPKVLLIRDRKSFEKMAGQALVVAFALPHKRMIVVDFSRMGQRPFDLRTTLKHELCHLVLHHYIAAENLPRWLDEGACQWASDSLVEIMVDTKPSPLEEATLSGRYVPLDALSEGFPKEGRPLLLAYEESKGFVEYLESEFGRGGILEILERLREGDRIETAVLVTLSVPLEELEMKWHRHLRTKTTWLTHLSGNLYVIVFFVSAVITVFGFIRVLRKKRRYTDDDEDETFSS